MNETTTETRTGQAVATNDWFSALEDLVKHGTESRGEAVVLMWDEEDGFFISTVDTGCHHYPVKDLTGERSATLVEAVQAAVKWHNKQGNKWYMRYLRPISLNNRSLPPQVGQG